VNVGVTPSPSLQKHWSATYETAGPAVSYDPQNLPENWPLSPDSNGIIAPDFDRDRDIDLRDFAIFQNSMIGP
jgi:hypothetical protein